MAGKSGIVIEFQAKARWSSADHVILVARVPSTGAWTLLRMWGSLDVGETFILNSVELPANLVSRETEISFTPNISHEGFFAIDDLKIWEKPVAR